MLLALTYKTPEIYKMETPYGVPLGFLLLIAIIIRFFMINSDGAGSVSDSPPRPTRTKFKRPAIRSSRFATYAPITQRVVETRSPVIEPSVTQIHSEESRAVGEQLVALVNETSDRTGFSPYHIGSLIREKTHVSFKMEDGKLNITADQLVMLAPHMETIREYCEKLPGKLSNYGIRVDGPATGD